MDNHGLLFNALIYLSAAVIAVPIAKRLGLGSVLGYLIAGIFIGPWGIGLIHDTEEILHFAEFGVVLLLFLIGLELNPKRLWALRQPILGMGGAQVVVTASLLLAIGLAIGLEFNTALIAAMGLSLSSTAIVLQILSERNLMNSSAGQSGFSILLFQDIAVIPMLAIIPLLGTASNAAGAESAGSLWWSILQVCSVIVLIVVGGHFAIRPIFRFIAGTRLREIFTAFSLLLVIGIALLMQAVNMSMALGAFLAGVLLAESEYRHELETDIEPFKGLLMGLFFIAVGMSVDFGVFLNMPLTILALVLGLIIIKIAVLWLIGRVFKIIPSQHYLFAFLLSQGGEFAFVLFSVADSHKIFPEGAGGVLVAIVALSMVTTPFLLIINEKWLEPRFTRLSNRPYDQIDERDNPVIIVGYGRFGQMIGRLLQANQFSTTIIDHDPDQIDMLRRFGHQVFYGDASRIDLLHAAGAEQAKLLVIAIDDENAVLDIIDIVQQHFPQLTIVARARNRTHAYALLDRGITFFERETFGSALTLGEKALQVLGFAAYEAKKAALKFRDHDLATMYKLHPMHEDTEQLITMSKQSRVDLENLFNEEYKSIKTKEKQWDWG